MLIDHGAVGFLFFGLLFLIVVESTVGNLCLWLSDRYPVLAASVEIRRHRAGLRIFSATLAFFLLAIIPAIQWRLQFGAWIH